MVLMVLSASKAPNWGKKKDETIMQKLLTRRGT